MLDPMPEQRMEPDTIEYYPQPNDRCECGHLEKQHYGKPYQCWSEDCGCVDFEIDPPLKKAPFAYYDAASAWNCRPTERRATKRPYNISGPMGVM